MRKEIIIIEPQLNEAETGRNPTVIETLYAAFLAALSEMVQCESALSGVDYWQPALRGFLTAVEVAETVVCDRKRAILDAKIETEGDRKLKIAALFLHLGMISTCPDEALHLLAIANRKQSDFFLPGETEYAAKINGMITETLTLVQTYLAIEESPVCGLVA
ncbi:MAG: hypothetical protein KGN33_16530 [Paracoccaceae bacterium]|nr:hypothetical protein [Paracoccaceae bacterium]